MAAVLVAAGIRWLLNPVLGTTLPFIVFVAAVVCAAWYGGLGPGLLAIVISTLLAEFLFLPPRYSLEMSSQGIAGGVLYLIVALSCVLLSVSLREARSRSARAERHLRDVFASISDDFIAVGPDWKIAFINLNALVAAEGQPPVREGDNLWDSFPQMKGTSLEAAFLSVMADRKPLRSEFPGPITGRWLDFSIYPTEHGIAVYARDMSAVHQAEESSRFIAEASRLLARSLNIDETINQVADLAVPRLADWCFVDLQEQDGTFRKVAIRGANQRKHWIEKELQASYVPDPNRPHPIMEAFRSGQPELVSQVTESWIRSRSRDPRHLELLQAMEIRSLMAIPLIVQKQLLGVLTLASAESGREYSIVDLQNAEALAVHIGLAISNSRLYYEAQVELHERKLIEQALRDSEGRFRTLVTATGAMVWRAAADGRAIEEPAGWEQVTGQPYAELKDDPEGWFARIHPADRQRVQGTWALARSSRRMVDVEFRLLWRDGSYRRMHTVGVPLLDEGGAIVEWIGTTIDVHERREAEEQLQRAQRMETVGRLAGGVAHETNNQMMVILSFVDFLLRGDNLSAEQRGDLDHLGRAAERVAGLTRQLLALSRRQVLETRVLELDTVVREAESVLRRTLGPEIQLSVKGDQGPKWVVADHTQLVQILVNLALNARDAITGSGELTISTRRAERAPAGGRLGTIWHDWGVALLSVADTGSGMDGATLARIFEPFYSTKPVGQRTGLGLSVVEGIVSQSGGDVWVESKPGYGTVVTIGLPLTAEPQLEEPMSGPVKSSGGMETILVVDDEEQVRRLLVRGLQLGDYRVLEAADGQEAIAILEQEGGNVQLVVTDIAMPFMSGVELTQRLFDLWPNLPIIFVSGHPFEVVAHDHQVIAHRRFLQKPFKVDTLLSVVRIALDEAIRDSRSPLFTPAP